MDNVDEQAARIYQGSGWFARVASFSGFALAARDQLSQPSSFFAVAASRQRFRGNGNNLHRESVIKHAKFLVSLPEIPGQAQGKIL